MIVLKTIRPLPYLLMLLVLKYSDTRFLSVSEKSEPADFANDNFLIIVELNKTYSIMKEMLRE